jgi:hypothetical protein
LQAHIHFRNFVEQQGAAVGFFELADTACDGPGEGPFFVAEGIAAQLTATKILSERRERA